MSLCCFCLCSALFVGPLPLHKAQKSACIHPTHLLLTGEGQPGKWPSKGSAKGEPLESLERLPFKIARAEQCPASMRTGLCLRVAVSFLVLKKKKKRLHQASQNKVTQRDGRAMTCPRNDLDISCDMRPSLRHSRCSHPPSAGHQPVSLPAHQLVQQCTRIILNEAVNRIGRAVRLNSPTCTGIPKAKQNKTNKEHEKPCVYMYIYIYIYYICVCVCASIYIYIYTCVCICSHTPNFSAQVFAWIMSRCLAWDPRDGRGQRASATWPVSSVRQAARGLGTGGSFWPLPFGQKIPKPRLGCNPCNSKSQ